MIALFLNNRIHSTTFGDFRACKKTSKGAFFKKKKKKKKEKNFYFTRSHVREAIDRSAQLNGHRLRTRRDEKLFQVRREWNNGRSWTNFCWTIVERYFDDVGAYVRKQMRNWYVLVKPLRIEKARECVWCMTQEAIVTDCSHLLELRLATPSFFPLSSFFRLFPPTPRLHSPFLWQRPSTYTFCTALSTLFLSGGRAAVNVLLTIAYFVRWYTAIVSLPSSFLLPLIPITGQSTNFAIIDLCSINFWHEMNLNFSRLLGIA